MTCRPLSSAVVVLVLAWSMPAAAQDLPDYLDDRSTAPSLVESLYNAIERKEYARAWSYYRDEPERPVFRDFAEGYAETAHVRVRTEPGTSDGAAGSIYHSVPVVVEATGTDGGTTVYAGCYELRMVQPAAQIKPPFQPIRIIAGELEASDANFESAAGDCPDEGL